MTILNPYFYTLNPDILAYENAWLNYMKTGERNATVINNSIWDSWERCRSLKMNARSSIPLQKVNENIILQRISRHQDILSIVSPFIHTLFDALDGNEVMISYSDKKSVILQCTYDEGFQERSIEIGLAPGAIMTEENAGTNSIDLSIRQKKPIALIGAEHYREIFHNLISASVPIIDFAGNLVGVLSVWGRHELATSQIIGMLISSARAIENKIQIQKINNQLIENNNQLKTILHSVPDSVLYIKDNMIMQCNDEMLKLIGKNNIINENIERTIITLPEIGQIINDSRKEFQNMKITLFGNHKSYNCLLNKRTVMGSHEKEIGYVLIFIQVEEIKKLSKALSKHMAIYTFEGITGKSDSIKNAINIAQKAAEHDSRVVIEGESGTGKEMFAQSIHNASNRRNNPFVAIDCGAIPKELFESTLFGYEKGAFTGAHTSGSTGAFESANKGTLFLDEIGNMPIEMQAKLLRVLQEKAVTKVGGNVSIPIDARVIVATNDHLQSLVELGKFREDLFYRLNVAYIKVPPLRERIGDIPCLVEKYLSTSSVRNREIKIDEQTISVLQKHDWPGNVRQLFNTIERAEIMTSSNIITVEDLPSEIVQSANSNEAPFSIDIHEKEFQKKKRPLKQLEHEYIMYHLKLNNNNIVKTAKELEISRPTIYKAINKDRGGQL